MEPRVAKKQQRKGLIAGINAALKALEQRRICLKQIKFLHWSYDR